MVFKFSQTVTVGGQPIYLTGREYSILELLALRKGSTLTKDMIMSHLYGGMDEPEIKIIDVFICKLRRKLSAAGCENLIETLWGRGYLLREPKPAGAPDGETPATPSTDEVRSTAGANG